MSSTTIRQPRRPNALVRFFRPFLLLRESKVGMIGAVLVLLWIFAAIFAPLLAPFPPNEQLQLRQAPLSTFYAAPNKLIQGVSVAETCDLVTEGEQAGNYDCGTFWFGTDVRGRDTLSRIIHGATQVLTFAPLATFCAYFVGIPMGLLAGYRRGHVDTVATFVANVILSFPVLVLYILIISTMDTGPLTIIAAVVFASSPGVFRIVRGLTLDLRTREYVYAAETRGESLPYILFVEILPNARGPLIVDAMLRLGYVSIAIGTLGFLGLGLPPPAPDWGQMIAQGKDVIQTQPYVALFPCLAISSLVLGFNLLADGLREVSLRD